MITQSSDDYFTNRQSENRKPIRLLYIEDDAGMARLMQKRLQRESIEVDTAPDGRKGMSMYDSAPYDVVAVDQSLPGMDGLSVIERLTKSDNLTPVVMITGRGNERVAVEALKLGACDYIIKDVENGYLDLMPTVIEQALRKKQMIQDKQNAERALAESEELHRLTLNNISDAIFVTDDSGDFKYVCSNVHVIFGYTFEEVEAMKNIEVLMGGNIPIDLKKPETLTEPNSIEWRIKDKRGIDHVVLVNIKRVAIKKGTLLYTCHDITDRKRMEENLKNSLKEKETLIQEIHHRVKNNMQVIIALLSLQSESFEDPKVVNIFNDTERRIRSMALVHEKLYRSQDLYNIEIKDYIEELARSLIKSYNIAHDRVILETDIEIFPVSINTATTCGLIINELITNSLQHAFPSGGNGVIFIKMSSTDQETVELRVGDNGAGLPADFDIGSSESFGMFIIRTLAEGQLQGKLELNRDMGTEFIIRFKNQ